MHAQIRLCLLPACCAVCGLILGCQANNTPPTSAHQSTSVAPSKATSSDKSIDTKDGKNTPLSPSPVKRQGLAREGLYVETSTGPGTDDWLNRINQNKLVIQEVGDGESFIQRDKRVQSLEELVTEINRRLDGDNYLSGVLLMRGVKFGASRSDTEERLIQICIEENLDLLIYYPTGGATFVEGGYGKFRLNWRVVRQ